MLRIFSLLKLVQGPWCVCGREVRSYSQPEMSHHDTSAVTHKRDSVGTLRNLAEVSHLSLLGLRLCLCHVLGVLLLSSGQVVEPGMLESGRRRDSHLWAKLQHLVEKVQPHLVDLREYQAEVLGCEDGEIGLVLGELRDAWP